MHGAPRSSDKRPMGTTFKNTPAVLGSLPASTRVGRSTVLWSVARLRRGAGPGGRRPGVRGWVVCVCVCVCLCVCVSVCGVGWGGVEWVAYVWVGGWEREGQGEGKVAVDALRETNAHEPKGASVKLASVRGAS